MELFELVENLERRVNGLVQENQALRETAQLAEVYQEENRSLMETLQKERENRKHIEERIGSMLTKLDEHLAEESA